MNECLRINHCMLLKNGVDVSAILFFGEGYQLDICSNFEMQAGSTDFIEMLRDGRTCKRASIHINVTDEEIEAWDHQEVSHTTDFATSIDKVFKNWKSKMFVRAIVDIYV